MRDLTLNLSIDEINLILEAVGNLPFHRVYALVGKVQKQASEQLGPQAVADPQRSSDVR